MIVCSCNVLSDHEVRSAASSAARRSTSHVYGCLGCSAQCGRCARTIRKIIDETLNGAKVGCPVGCACALHAAADVL
jgi:bacterioferritin-associated ferredoxin